MPLPVTIPDIDQITPGPPPFEVDGRYYVVAVDDSTDTAVKVVRADGDDPTDAFSEIDSAGRPGTTNTIESIGASIDGTVIHVLTLDNSDDVDYHSFDADGTGGEGWNVTVEEVVTDADSGGGEVAHPGIRGNGDVVIAYMGAEEGNMGSNYGRIYIAYRESGSWTVDVRIDNLGKVEFHLRNPTAVMADKIDNRFHVFYHNSSTNDLLCSVWLGDNSFDVNGQDIVVESAAMGSLTGTRNNGTVSFDDGGTIKIRTLYSLDFTGPGRVGGHDDEDVPSPSNFGNVNDTSDMFFSTLAVDGKTQHALFILEADDTQLVYNKTGDGDDIWGDDAVEIDSGSGINIYSANVYQQGGNTVLAYMYIEGTNVKYNQKILAAAGPDLSDQEAESFFPFQPPLFSYLDIIGY